MFSKSYKCTISTTLEAEQHELIAARNQSFNHLQRKQPSQKFSTQQSGELLRIPRQISTVAH